MIFARETREPNGQRTSVAMPLAVHLLLIDYRMRGAEKRFAEIFRNYAAASPDGMRLVHAATAP